MPNKISINRKIIFEEDNVSMAAFCEKLNKLIIKNGYTSNSALVSFACNINQDAIYYGGINCELSEYFNSNIEDLKILLKLLDFIIIEFNRDISFYQRLAKKLKNFKENINKYLNLRLLEAIKNK